MMANKVKQFLLALLLSIAVILPSGAFASSITITPTSNPLPSTVGINGLIQGEYLIRAIPGQTLSFDRIYPPSVKQIPGPDGTYCGAITTMPDSGSCILKLQVTSTNIPSVINARIIAGVYGMRMGAEYDTTIQVIDTPAPMVTNINPVSGSSVGGTQVTITGKNLNGASSIQFGGVNASSFNADSNTQITATAPAGTGAVDVSVTTPGGMITAASKFTYSGGKVLQSIVVTPATSSIAVGLTEQFKAVGTYSDGSTPDITTKVVWSSADPIIAKMSSTTPGLVTGVAANSTTITATDAATGKKDTVSLTVTDAVLESIAVTADTPSIAVGINDKFKAMGTYSGSSIPVDITTQVTWSSDTPTVATIDPDTGVATGVAVSTTPIKIIATSKTTQVVIGSTMLTVTQSDPTVTSLSQTAGPVVGGNTITIYGTNFVVPGVTSVASASMLNKIGSVITGLFGNKATSIGDATTVVNFGSVPVTPNAVTNTTMTVTVPPGSGTVDVTVTIGTKTSVKSEKDKYTYYDGPAPTVIAITPNTITIDQLQPIKNIVVTGTGFLAGATVTFVPVGSGTSIPAIVTGTTAPTRIVCSADFSQATPGIYNVKVTNPDTQTGLLSGGFVVNRDVGTMPVITSINPHQESKTNVGNIVLTGRNFASGATVTFVPVSGGTSISAIVKVTTPAKITCSADFSTATTGFYNVQVTFNGQTGLLVQGFVVNSSTNAPTVKGITPNSGIQGGNYSTSGAGLVGTNFLSGATVQLRQAGVIILTSIRSGGSDTEINFDASLPSTASGVWDVVVINPDGQIGLLPMGFTINPVWTLYTVPVIGNATVKGVYATGSGANTNIYLATSGGLSFNASNGTGSWTTTTDGLGSNTVNGVYATGSGSTTNIYAATSNGLSFNASNGAGFWTTTTDVLGSNTVNGVYVLNNTIYAATQGGLSVYSNGKWNNYNKNTSGFGNSSVVYGVYAIGDGGSNTIIYAATNAGLAISKDNGGRWSNTAKSEDPLSLSDRINGVYATGSGSTTNIYAATNSSGLVVSTDNGSNWRYCTKIDGLGSDIINGVYVLNNTIYLATDAGLSVSTNDGATWTNYASFANNNVYGVYAVATSSGTTTVYVATAAGLAVATNGP